MRVKVLEALAAGKAIVATPLALEGLELTNGEQVLVAETASTFAACLVELLTDVERRRLLAEAARRWAEKNLDVEAQARAFEGLYATVLGSTAAARASDGGGT
jgi:glycosyltransferase involved in cell wall biosynthesis